MQREPYDLPIAVTKTAAMRYLAETAGHGYVLHQSGTVPAAKLLHLIEKLDARYRILATRGMRDNDRLRGRSCAKLVVFPKEDGPSPEAGTTWLFWLMATEGTGPLPLETSTRDSRRPAFRLRWLDQYELVSRPVRRRSGELAHVWTWVFQDAFLDRWRRVFKKAAGRVRSSVERKPDYLIKLVTSLRRVPGFHGINRQKRSLILGADIPSALHASLELRRLGSVVNKALPIFVDGQTVRVLTNSEISSQTVLPEKPVIFATLTHPAIRWFFEERIVGRTANDDRSDSMNPNNDAYDDSLDNHANQLNPNNDEYKGSTAGDED